MSTKAAAFHAWAASFGIPAYAASSVPDDAVFPYLTYVFGYNDFNDEPFSVEVDLWYRGCTEAVPNAKANEISRNLGRTGRMIPCDGGGLLLMRGSPFCQAVQDEDGIKRRYINVDLESVTND